MKKRFIKVLLLLAISNLLACSSRNDTKTEQITEIRTEAENNNEAVLTKKDASEVEQGSQVESTEVTSQTVSEQAKTVLQDYSELFDGRNGCAIIYDVDQKEYQIYNETMINTEVSPYSTFKIVSTLIGLNHQMLIDENTTMNYNKTKYPIESWNHNLTLSEAFQESCVWYFRQVIDGVGYEKVQEELTQLNYGNQDISVWEGAKTNSLTELNGFWLGSSLKISPMEQVLVLEKIFQGKSQFSEEHIDLLRKIMLTDKVNGYEIWGKTGSGQNEGWYVGLAHYVGLDHKDSSEYYFAVYLNEEQGIKQATGSIARNILINIFSDK